MFKTIRKLYRRRLFLKIYFSYLQNLEDPTSAMTYAARDYKDLEAYILKPIPKKELKVKTNFIMEYFPYFLLVVICILLALQLLSIAMAVYKNLTI